MLLKVKIKDVVVLIETQNIVCMSEKNNKHMFEVSCPNLDVYRFTYNCATTKNAKRFQETCERVMEAREQKRELFVCSLEEFEGLKFEKHSLGSIIS